MKREDALRIAQQPDPAGAEVDTTAPGRVSVAYTTRLPDELAQWLEGEATRRGVTPPWVLRDLVDEAARGR